MPIFRISGEPRQDAGTRLLISENAYNRKNAIRFHLFLSKHSAVNVDT